MKKTYTAPAVEITAYIGENTMTTFISSIGVKETGTYTSHNFKVNFN